MYNAAGGAYQCGPWMDDPEAELDDWFARARRDFDGRAIRFWAYQRYTNGGTDWTAFDRVVRLATKHGLKLVPTLENQWGTCSLGGYRYDSWYAGGYAAPYGGYPLSFKEYARRVVTRYKDESAIALWMLMNEAESKTTGGTAAPEPLYAFARDMSAYLKSLDPNHLVALGVMGSGQPGVAGTNYERLHALPGIDVLTYHDYGRNDEPVPASLAAAFSVAARLDKPLLVAEAGMTVCGPYDGWQQETQASRAQKMDAKLGAALERGADGYLAWVWHPSSNCYHDFTTGDPLNGVLAKWASAPGSSAAHAPDASPTPSRTPAPTRTATPRPTATAAGFDYASLPGERTQLFSLVNQARAEVGVPPLAWHARLAELAQWRVEDMEARRYSGHQIPAGACFEGRCWSSPVYFWDVATAIGLHWEAAGENLWQAADYRDQLAEVANGVFRGSPSHYAAMVNRDFTLGGTGMSRYTWTNGTHTVELFLRPAAASVQAFTIEASGSGGLSAAKARR